MKVHFFATLRPIVGGKTAEFEVDHGITVQEMLNVMPGSLQERPALRRVCSA